MILSHSTDSANFSFPPTPNFPPFLSFSVGYRTKMDSSSIFGTNQKVMEEELERKAEEYRNKEEIAMISQQCERAKVR